MWQKLAKTTGFSACTLLSACGGLELIDGECTPGQSNSYLPLNVGNSWNYGTIAADQSGFSTTKAQSIIAIDNHPEDGLPILVQETIKDSGKTINWLREDDDKLVRLQQQDYDRTGQLERTTVYDPPRLRFDQSPDRLSAGASWTINYTEIETDSITNIQAQRNISESWVVLSIDEPCPNQFAQFQCLHLVRTENGKPAKDYWYVRGIGKVREEGGQIEQLRGCSVN